MHSNLCYYEIETKKYNINRDRERIRRGITHTVTCECVKKGVLWEHSSYQCESYECASLRIRSFRFTRPQISASIPSETDYPGLSQTQRIITGSPLGHCSLHAPRMEMHCWARCQRRLGGYTGYSLTLAYPKTTDKHFFLLSWCCLFLSVYIFPLQFSNFYFFTPLICHIRFSSPSLPQTWTQSQLSCLPPLSLSGAPILHIAHVSLFHPPVVFHISCVSPASPPSGPFTDYNGNSGQ